MKHSKQLTVLVVTLLILLIFGIAFSLYLLNMSQSAVLIDSAAETDSATKETDQSEEAIRSRLEAVMGTQPPASTASTSETIDRLNAVMEQSEPIDSEAVKARLEAVMNNTN